MTTSPTPESVTFTSKKYPAHGDVGSYSPEELTNYFAWAGQAAIRKEAEYEDRWLGRFVWYAANLIGGLLLLVFGLVVLTSQVPTPVSAAVLALCGVAFLASAAGRSRGVY